MAKKIKNEFLKIKEVKLLDTTLREGMQLKPVNFSLDQQLAIVEGLEKFGIDFIELTSAVAYPSIEKEIVQIRKNCRKAKLLIHCRANKEDIKKALALKPDGIDLFMGISPWSRKYAHGREKKEIIETVIPLIKWLKKEGVFVRFGAEDAFRTKIRDLFLILKAIVKAGVDQIDLADTLGSVHPFQVRERIELVKKAFPKIEIEFHSHNDIGCAVANSLAALLGGASVIDVSLLGIGERVGITPLGGLISALWVQNPRLLKKYDLKMVIPLEKMIASFIGCEVPFNQPLSSPFAWCHSAGTHLKAIVQNPKSYEVLDPNVFGGKRILNIGSRLTGKNILAERAKEIGLNLSHEQILQALSQVKSKAILYNRDLELEEVDEILKKISQS